MIQSDELHHFSGGLKLTTNELHMMVPGNIGETINIWIQMGLVFFGGGFCWHLLLISSYGHQPLSTKLWCPGHAWPILCRSNLGIPRSHHPDLRRASFVHELVS